MARVFVNPAIKKALCRDAGADRSWLTKIRPTYGHNYHFHIRLACPDGAAGCSDQDPPPPGDGCGADLAYWFRPEVMHPQAGTSPPAPDPGAAAGGMPQRPHGAVNPFVVVAVAGFTAP